MSLYGKKTNINTSSIYAIGGSGLSQALLLLAAPVLTRLYTPEEFGIFSVYIAVVSFLSMVVFLRYELAIPLSRSLTSTLSIFKVCLIVGAVISLIILGVLHFLTEDVFQLLSNSEYYLPLWIIPAAALSLSLLNLCRFWLVKANRFDIIALSRGSVSLLLLTVQLIGGWFKVGSFGLIAGHLIGNIITAIALVAFVFRKYFFALRNIKLNSIKNVLIKYVNFPKYIVLSDSLLTLGAQAPAVVIASAYSVSQAGFFALAYRVALAPVVILAESFGKVFMSRALILKRGQTLPFFVRSFYLVLVRIAIVPFLIITFTATDLVLFVFGEGWGESGSYITLLVPTVISIFVFVPVMTLFIVLERQKMELRCQSFILVLRMAGLLVGVVIGNLQLTILMYSLFTSFGYVIAGCWIMGQSGVRLPSIFATSMFEIFTSTLIVSPIGFLVFYSTSLSRMLVGWYGFACLLICGFTLVCYLYRIKSSFNVLRGFDLGVSGKTNSQFS
jgi:O-antigen/teichoic acid export membrane protein